MMSDSKLTIEQRKEKAKAELEVLQKKLEASVKELKDKIEYRAHPKKLVSKHPFLILGAALLGGFILAGSRKKRKNKFSDDNVEAPVNISYGPTMKDMLMLQIKRIIAEKGFNYAMDVVENVVKKKMEEKGQSES